LLVAFYLLALNEEIKLNIFTLTTVLV